jgi:hypothetical protein
MKLLQLVEASGGLMGHSNRRDWGALLVKHTIDLTDSSPVIGQQGRVVVMVVVVARVA